MHCCAHHQKPFLYCTRGLCSPCDVRFDVASSLVQVLVCSEGKAPDDGHNSARNMLSGVQVNK
jgi:hypothetical protein